MAHLSLTLLGQFQIRLADQLLTNFESDKVRALLCYLAVEPSGVPHSRDSLAALLWPGYSDESARTNLRQTLYHLRKTLGDDQQAADNGSPFLLVTRQTIALNPAASCQVDVRRFGALLAATTSHDHRALADCPACRQHLRQAVDLYQGEFLTGFTVADSIAFEEWRRITQEQLHGQALTALTQLADAAEAVMDFTEAHHYAERQLQLEPWREAAHRQLMRILAHSGQRTAALAQYQRCCETLRAELNVDPDSETTALFEQIRAGKLDKVTSDKVARWQGDKVTPPTNTPVTLSPPHPVTPSPLHPVTLSPVTEAPHNLPTPLTPFVGRIGELAKLLAQLQQPDCRLLTLVGPGGMGKTRLALAVARQRLGSYADGVFFVSLASLTDSAGVAPTIATTLDLRLPGGDPQTALLKLLAPKQLLLLLDNFEHLLGAAGLVADLLQSAPRVQILVTSRARLNLQGEHFTVVQPLSFGGALAVGESGSEIGAEIVAETANADAVRLFVQSAQRNQPDFRLDQTKLPAVLRICQLVEGMPLGLEMAAGWVELLSLTEIASEIERSVDFLTAEWVNAPDRQRSMRAVFSWSWHLLTATEQRVFRQLALFRGGFTREAAEQVVGASLRVLAALVHKSLVRLIESGANPSHPRYEIHELLRQLAAEQLAGDNAEYEAAGTRHSDFYLAFVAARESRLTRAEPRETAAEIQTEIDNIRQAWAWAVQRGNLRRLEPAAWTLRCFYETMGYLSEGIQAFHAVAEQIANQPGPVLRKLSAIHANLLISQGKYGQGITAAQQVIAGVATADASEALALSHLSWGQALHRQGQFTEAQRHYEQTLQLVHTAHAQLGPSELFYDVECTAHVWLCGLSSDLGLFEKARTYVSQSLHLAQTLGKRRVEMTCLLNLANIARERGDYPAARRDYEQALRLVPQVGYRWAEASCQLELGDVVRLQGEYSLAITLIKGALTLFRAIGVRDLEALALTWLGRLYAYVGDYAQADQWLARYLASAPEVKRVEAEINYLHARLVLALHRGEPTQALIDANQAWQSDQSAGFQSVRAYAFVLIGHAQTQVGQFAKAADAYQQALALYSEIGRADIAAEAQAGLAAIAYKQGDEEQAQRLVEAVLKRLVDYPTAGQDEPFYLYLTCSQILAATHDPRATMILQQGYDLLQQYAERITDDALRRSFWENVPIHAALRQAYDERSSSLVYTNGLQKTLLAEVVAYR